jgi:hypothetical protein
MSRVAVWLLLLVNSPITVAYGLFVGVDGSAGPFQLAYRTDSQSYMDLIFQLGNDGEATLSVLSWQMDLEIRPMSGAQGSLQITNVQVPPESLFGQNPGAQFIGELPSERIVAFDVENSDEFDGEPVNAGSASNVLQVTLQSGMETAGFFQVVTPVFDSTSPESGSSWIDAATMEPRGFSNAASSAFPGSILLGTVEVRGTRTGDYNEDGDVNFQDYSRWRATFGEQVAAPGTGADGNSDGLIDAADFVVWRKYSSDEFDGGQKVASVSVPEPRGVLLVVTVVLNSSCVLRRYLRERPCRRI